MLSPEFYTWDQLKAWAPTPADQKFWSEGLDPTQPYLCWINDKLTGFIELENGGYIDCLYTDPGFQRCGVGTALYRHVETLAIERAYEKLSVDAPKVARNFFLAWALRLLMKIKWNAKDRA